MTETEAEDLPKAKGSKKLTAGERSERRRELIATIMLSIATVLSAWSAFQATKWHGQMSVAHSDANSARAQYTVASEEADAAFTLDMKLFTEWLDAHNSGHTDLANGYAASFRDGFRTAFNAWLADNPPGHLNGSKMPFDYEQYSIPEQAKADELFRQAEELSNEARADVRNADNYTLTTVMLASVLFFAGISVKLDSGPMSWFLLSVGGLLLVGATVAITQIPVAS
ncbi:MAG: hypothetical protein DCC49_07540 [Acidobacteria bacterium]|nr:MAG: hypothetical protein DCC49_07540 [Acidobacteriota bacterium]